MLLVFAVLAHWQLVVRGLVIADYDAYVYFYANRAFTAAELLAGHLPLWNPFVFAGAPHLANPQSAVFYPGTWLFLLLSVPYAYSLNLVLHTFLAGAGTYLLVRHGLGGSRTASVCAGLCYQLSGPLAAQGGHLNQLSAAALLPLIVHATLRAQDTLCARWVMISAALIALQLFAGHPQVTYMTLIGAAFMLVWRLAEDSPKHWLVRIGIFGAPLALALGLAAVQLLPTLEVTRQGIRAGGLFIGEAVAGSLSWELLPLVLLPGYTENPPSTEALGYIGAIALTLSALALGRGFTRRQGWIIALAVLSLLLAMGSSTGVFDTLFGRVPGFSSFRVPARWLLLWSFTVSIVAGLSLDLSLPASFRQRAALVILAVVPAIWLSWFAQSPDVRALYVVPSQTVVIWLFLAGLTVGIWLVVRSYPQLGLLTSMMVGLIGLELLFARSDLPFHNPVPEVAWTQPPEIGGLIRSNQPEYRFLSISGDGYQPDDAAAWRAKYPELSEDSFSQFLTALKWGQTLAPNLSGPLRLQSVDGYDGGVLPLSRFVLASSALHPTGDVRPDGVLISSLDVIPRASALDLFGVRVVVASHEKDAMIDGIYFDRATGVTLNPGESITVRNDTEWTPNEVDVLAALVDGESAEESGALEINWGSQAGWVHSTEKSHPVVALWRLNAKPRNDSLVKFRFGEGARGDLSIRNAHPDKALRVTAVSFIGQDAEQQQAGVLTQNVTRENFGDVRGYVRDGALARAFLVHAAEVVDDEQALERMFDPEWKPADSALLAEPLDYDSGGASHSDVVRWVQNDPELVKLDVSSESDAVLVLSDAWYPGWQARIDGIITPIVRANVHFRAVSVPAGQHRVEFVYDAAIVKVGALLSGVALVITALFWRFGDRLMRHIL